MSKISIFPNVGYINSPTDMDIDMYLEKTKDGEWGLEAQTLRAMPLGENGKDTEERKRYKATIETCCLSGVFSHRADIGIVQYSGYINIDLDHLSDQQMIDYRRMMEMDDFVYAVWTSIGGRGLRVLFKVPNKKEKHRDYFRGIRAYLFDRYKILEVDNNGINISKPYLVSWDEKLHKKESCDTFPTAIPEPKVDYASTPGFIYEAGDFEEILKNIEQSRVAICSNYEEWLKIGYSLVSQFGESGEQYFHRISLMGDYKEKDTHRQYKYCLRTKPNNGSIATIATFYYLANKHGVKIISERTKTIIRAVNSGKKSGLKVPQIIENIKKFHGISDADKLIEKAFVKGDNEFDEDLSVLEQAEMFITANYNSNGNKLEMNEITGYLELNGNVIDENKLNSMWVAARKSIDRLDYTSMVRLLTSDFVSSYNPFFRFFDSDGVPVRLPAIPVPNDNRPEFKSPLIDKLASCIENSNPSFTTFFLRKWVVSMISAAYGVHSPLMLTLIGPQYSGKTEFFRGLLPKSMRHWYAESKLDKGKDDELLMTQYWLLVDDEMSGKSKTEAQKFKNMTSAEYFYLRRPYGKSNEKIKRLAVLGASTNSKQVLNDPTGNRRIIPIDVKMIKFELYNSINMDELFKEAHRLYKAGFDWRITPADIAYLNSNSTDYTTDVKERDLLCKFFKPLEIAEDGKTPAYGTVPAYLTATEIMIELMECTNLKSMSLNAVVQELETTVCDGVKFFKRSKRLPSGTGTKWWVERINRKYEGLAGTAAPELKGEDPELAKPF